MNAKEGKRLYYLDWLRVISIFLVFLHHVGMPYSGHSWISDYQEKSDSLYTLMIFFEQWRLHLLFLISGAGTYLAFSKRSVWQFASERTQRLLIPFYFGVFFIVPPQTYLQFKDQFNSYWDMYPDVFLNRQVHHLWFLKTLFAFSIVAIPLIFYLRNKHLLPFKIPRLSWPLSKKVITGLCISVIGTMSARLFFQDNPEVMLSNFHRIIPYFLFFATGILLASDSTSWNIIFQHRKRLTYLLIISTIGFYSIYFFKDFLMESKGENHYQLLWQTVRTLMGWAAVLTLIGYAVKYLNRTHPWLVHINEAVFPFYVLHQSIIVIIAYYLIPFDIFWFFKLLITLVVSLVLSIGIYRFIIFPIRPLWIFFGIKYKKKI